jgi:hypothetical protein
MSDDVINIFGSYLSEIIHKPALATKGLIRFLIQEYEKDHAKKEALSFQDFEFIIAKNLGPRLTQAQIPNLDHIIQLLEQKLLEQQAIFTMDK